MKNKKYLIYLFSLLALTSATRVASVQASPSFYELNDDYCVRVTLPEETLDQVKMVYPVNGNDVTVKPGDGEIVSLSIQDDMLNTLVVPFTAKTVGDDIIIKLGDPDPNSLNPEIVFHSTLEAASIDKEASLVITAPGATAQVGYCPEGPQITNEVNNQFPLAIDENLKVFDLDGVLDIKFFVKPATENKDAGGDGDNNGGTDGNTGGLNPGEPTTGGCSFSPATGTSFGTLAWSVLLLPLYFGRRMKRNANR